MAEPSAPGAPAGPGAPVTSDAPPPRRPWSRRAAKPILGAVAVVVVLLLVLTTLGLSSAPRNSAYDEGPRGLSQLASALQGEGITTRSLATGPHALDTAEQPGKSVLLVAGVERAYSAGEVQAVRDFVHRGGIAFIADDFGYGDAVGASFGVTFDKRQLRDANFDRNVSLVKVNASLASGNLSFTMNVPASLGAAPGANVSALARSGSDSYIDENLDGQEDTGDIKGPFLVLVAVSDGPGQALFASDPGMLANDLAADNGPFLKALFKQLLPDGGTLLVDESRHGQGAGAPLAALLAGEVQATSDLVIALAAGAAGLVLAAALFSASPRTEDISRHASTLDQRAHADTAQLTALRLRRLARRLAEQRSRLRMEELERATPEQLAAHVPDPLLKQLVLGQSPKAETLDLLRKVKLLGQKDGGQP